MEDIDKTTATHESASTEHAGRFQNGVESLDASSIDPVARERLLRQAAARSIIVSSEASSPAQHIAVHVAVEK